MSYYCYNNSSPVLFGIGVGLSGASANLQAILTEKVSKKHLMGAYHGGWSLGGFAGAGVLLVLLKILSFSVNESIWGLLIVLFIAMVIVSQFMLTFGSDPNAKITKSLKAHCPSIQSLLFLVYCPLCLTW